jgi:UDP-perosamine 4-acetyltransferase
MSNKPVIYLLGAGGHGKVVADALAGMGTPVTAILDHGLSPGAVACGATVLGDDDALARLDPATALLALGVGANPSTSRRAAIFNDAKSQGWNFISVKHKSVISSDTCVVAEGCQLMAGVILQSGVRLGINTVINTGARIDHDCAIGAHAFISPGVTLCGDVQVGDEVFIGAGAVVAPGIKIGSGAVIGAGAIVLRDIADGNFAAGNPATIKKRAIHV